MGGKSLINGEVEYTSVVAGRSVKVVVRLSSAGMNFCTPSGLELYPLGRRGIQRATLTTVRYMYHTDSMHVHDSSIKNPTTCSHSLLFITLIIKFTHNLNSSAASCTVPSFIFSLSLSFCRSECYHVSHRKIQKREKH